MSDMENFYKNQNQLFKPHPNIKFNSVDKMQINLYSCGPKIHRFRFSTKIVDELLEIKNKDKIILCIHGEEQILNLWANYLSGKTPGFEIRLYKYDNPWYLAKTYTSMNTPCKYTCKLDDDALISRYVWDYMIDNLDKLSDKNPVIAPIFTNGIPSTELFVEDFLNEEDQKTAHSLFLSGTILRNQWNLDYEDVNNKIKSMKKWDGREYWDYMENADIKWETSVDPATGKLVPWSYFAVRGVHPARFSKEYNMFIADRIIENKDKFFGKNDYRLEEYHAPYWTNNIVVATNDFWLKSVPIHNDGWDEGCMNLRMMMDESRVLYVRNGFGIHMAYGMTEGQPEIERYYTENL